MREHVPFAVQIYRSFLSGKSIADLADQFGIPEERIERRLRAAAQYFTLRPAAAGERKVLIRIIRRF